jgi:energy-coupling factor transporter ATP-binding protein EcfA2
MQKERGEILAAYDAKVNRAKKRNPNFMVLDKSDNIIFHKVAYAYPNTPTNLVLSRVTFSIQAGQVVAIGGEPSVGKKAMLKLLARTFKPLNEDGFVSYPSKWRVRFIDTFPTFFGGDSHKLYKARKRGAEALKIALKESSGTLDYNLKFGCDFEHPDETVLDLEIFNLLTLLGMSKHLIGANFDEYGVGDNAKKFTHIGINGEKLSQTDRSLLSIARALLSSVDFLIIQNVLDVLGPKHGCEVLFILKEFTANRGLPNILCTETNRIPFHLRKKKTVVFSTSVKTLQNMADNWIIVTRREEEKDEESQIRPVASTTTSTPSNTRPVLSPLEMGQS